MEQGYSLDPSREFDLWWIPESAEGITSRSASSPESGGEISSNGHFLILDQGSPLVSDNMIATGLQDLECWQKLHNFGIDQLHKTMSSVIYRPMTPEGNVTLLTFNSSRAESGETLRPHGS
jgi:hypothetical protein